MTMRSIDTILIHCSATPAGRDFTVADIDRWHRSRGFDRVGYHYIVYRDGTYVRGRRDDAVGAHCPQEGMNRRSLSICYIGGLDSRGENPVDTRTPEQRRTIVTLIRTLLYRYPSITRVCGHRDVKGVAKACPCFDAGKEYAPLLRSVRDALGRVASTVNRGKPSRKALVAVPLLIAASMIPSACSPKSISDVPTVVTVDHSAVHADTLRMEASKIDSVWIRDSVYVRDSGDTVRMEVWHWRERDRFRSGSEVRSSRDTVVREIPVTVERRVEIPVEKMVEKERPLPRWKRALMAVGIIPLVYLLFRILALLPRVSRRM